MPDLETAARTVWKDETAELNALKGSLKVVEAQVKIDKVPAFSSSMGAFAKVPMPLPPPPPLHALSRPSHIPLANEWASDLSCALLCPPQGRGREARQGAGGA